MNGIFYIQFQSTKKKDDEKVTLLWDGKKYEIFGWNLGTIWS